MLKRNLKGFVLFCCYEFIGANVILINITDFAILLFKSSYGTYTHAQTTLKTTCYLSGCIFIGILSGFVFNSFKKRPLMSLSLLIFTICICYLYNAIEIYDGLGS